jgi:hypothetical protein
MTAPAFGHGLPPTSSGTRYIKTKLKDLPRPAGYEDIKDWTSFTNFNTAAEARKALASNPNDVANITDRHELTRFGPYSRYSTAAATNLGDFFGRKNHAVKHKPERVSENAAASWIGDRALKAKDDEEKAYWAQWGVKSVDLDNDPATTNNVIILDDVRARKVKAGSNTTQPGILL